MVEYTETRQFIPHLDPDASARRYVANKMLTDTPFARDILAQRTMFIDKTIQSDNSVLTKIPPFRGFVKKTIEAGFNDGFYYNTDQTSIAGFYPAHQKANYSPIALGKQASFLSFTAIFGALMILGTAAGLIAFAAGAVSLLEGVLIGLAGGATLGTIAGGITANSVYHSYEKYNGLGFDYANMVVTKETEKVKQQLGNAIARTHGPVEIPAPPKKAEETVVDTTPKTEVPKEEPKKSPPEREEELPHRAPHHPHMWHRRHFYHQPHGLYSQNPYLCPQPQYIPTHLPYIAQGMPYIQQAGYVPQGPYMPQIPYVQHTPYMAGPYTQEPYMPQMPYMQQGPYTQQGPYMQQGYYAPQAMYMPQGMYAQQGQIPPYLPHAQCLPHGPYDCPANPYFGASPFANQFGIDVGYNSGLTPPFGAYSCVGSPVTYGFHDGDGIGISQRIIQTDVGGSPSWEDRMAEEIRNGSAYGINSYGQANVNFPRNGRW